MDTIFARFARLTDMPIVVVLVFDGPSRPSEKRGADIPPTQHWMEREIRELAAAFGFHCHTVRASLPCFLFCTDVNL